MNKSIRSNYQFEEAKTKWNESYDKQGIFLGLFWGQISAPSHSKNEQKLPKIVNNIPNSLAMLQMHIFRSNYKGQCNYTDIYWNRKSVQLKFFFYKLVSDFIPSSVQNG